MPLYYFILKDGRNRIPDIDGEEFVDDAAARDYAEGVARELMMSRELQRASWLIQVCDDYLRLRFEVLFASVDPTKTHLPLEFRRSHEIVSRSKANLSEAIVTVRQSLLDLRATLGAADQMLAATLPHH